MPMQRPEVPDAVYDQSLRGLWFPYGSLPVREIHQSWLSVYRECHEKGFLYGETQRSDGTYHMMGGSVYHLGMEDAAGLFNRNGHTGLQKWYGWAGDRTYWRELIQKLDDDPRNTYSPSINRDRFADKLADTASLRGVSVREIIANTITILGGSGFKILYSEKVFYLPMDYGIGAKGTPFKGTVDLVLQHRTYKPSQIAVVDTKTSGMWNAFFKNKAPTGQSFKEEQIANYLQLLHYSWMGARAGLWNAEDVVDLGIHTPVNLTKYVSGKKKGQHRGPAIFWGKPDQRAIENYAESMQDWLLMAYNGVRARLFPGIFGKISCGTCAFRESCLRDKKSVEVPDYLRAHMDQPHIRD